MKVYSFWGIHQNVDIATITKMEQSRCLLSSPAASLKRLAIYYGKCDVVYISPRNQDDFISEINRIISSGNGI
ncbi:MAG: PH domain-containing protein [Prevotella sp.]